MILCVDSITGHRGQNVVLRDVSFTLDAGQSIAVTGANGSGKSTLLRILAGLGDPVAGSIVNDTPAHWIGPVSPLKPTLTVCENLAFWSALQGGDTNAIPAALDHFKIAHLSDRPVATLSSGQKQRATLARLFLSPAKLWLLDEPESALDHDGRDLMQTALTTHLKTGGSALIATHHPDVWHNIQTLPLSLSSPSPQRGEGRGEGAPLSHPPLRRAPSPNPLPVGERAISTAIAPIFTATLHRDLAIFLSQKADIAQPIMLFILMITLFPLSLGPDSTAPIAGGLVMMAAFFAALLPLENIFADDAADGTIETIMTTSAPLPVYTAARMLAHWLANGLPVTILSPFALIMLGLHPIHPVPAVLTVLAATLLFTLIGASLSALVLSTRKGSILLALLAAPLYIPVLIFGSGAFDLSSSTPLILLWAMVALFLPLAPLMASGCLRLMRD